MRTGEGSGSTTPLELQSPLSSAAGERRDAAVVLVAAAVEDACLDALLLGALGEQLAAALGLLHRVEAAQVLLGPVDRRDGAAGVVVDELGEEAAVRAVNRQDRKSTRLNSSHLV